MKFLWIDPWTKNIGLCLADEKNVIAFNTVKWKSTLNKDERLFTMMPEIKNFIFNEKIDCAFIEYPVVFRNVKSSMALAESLWRIKSILYWLQIQVRDVYVQEVKKAVWAIKKEDIIKKTVIECEKNNWIQPSTEHEADAYRIMKSGSKKFLVDELIKNGKKKMRNQDRTKWWK